MSSINHSILSNSSRKILSWSIVCFNYSQLYERLTIVQSRNNRNHNLKPMQKASILNQVSFNVGFIDRARYLSINGFSRIFKIMP
jgi:hypothetical protein